MAARALLLAGLGAAALLAAHGARAEEMPVAKAIPLEAPANEDVPANADDDTQAKPAEATPPAAQKPEAAPKVPEAAPKAVASLPKGFVHLASIDASIVQDMRYSGVQNFTGTRVPGYEAASCILAEPVAKALSKVQAGLKADGLTLVMLDCYRPARSVKAMVAAMAKRKGTNAIYHPRVPATRLVAEGYLAARSGHSAGGTVDLTLARIGPDGKTERLAMGTIFDFFDPKSHTGAKGIDATARANRDRLVKAMTAGGFANYAREWWHFRFTAEPFKGRHFDFPVTAAPEAPKS